MAEYAPSDENMREKYLWAHAREAEGVAEQSYALQVCGEVWDAWLAAHDARARRDAAREALDGLAAELMEAARDCATDGDHGGAGAWRNASAHTYHYRDTHYPETEDQT